MKKIVLLWFLATLCCQTLTAQERTYLVFEFIRIETGKTVDYLEYKDFLSNIYREAIDAGDIVGWDLWSLQRSADPDAFHYATVTYYDDPVKMMSSSDMEFLINHGKKAFSDMSEEQLYKKIRAAHDDRDLALRSYMVEVAKTKDDFEYKPGTLASFDLMKAMEGRFDEYERVEQEVFLPIHERKIKAGLMENWRFLRTAVPTGSEASSTHMTMNVYKNYLQFFNSLEYEDIDMNENQLVAVEKGLQSRDQKWVYLATLETVVR
ncbi:hypothetical protein [Pleomorphovibrio marinus]|uniref:hypothetical protein n=1 Tax=Pleomorphovibrio marinus TaxID=2164132 RepID=UPI000E0C87DA|nr:hypothetical protein [Pleomorphovibrio marinus]